MLHTLFASSDPLMSSTASRENLESVSSWQSLLHPMMALCLRDDLPKCVYCGTDAPFVCSACRMNVPYCCVDHRVWVSHSVCQQLGSGELNMRQDSARHSQECPRDRTMTWNEAVETAAEAVSRSSPYWGYSCLYYPCTGQDSTGSVSGWSGGVCSFVVRAIIALPHEGELEGDANRYQCRLTSITLRRTCPIQRHRRRS